MQFHEVTGAQVREIEDWAILAWNPFFVIMNIAVGGNYPGCLYTVEILLCAFGDWIGIMLSWKEKVEEGKHMYWCVQSILFVYVL
jgi:hypothetical protein